jgi:hypothetical protein
MKHAHLGSLLLLLLWRLVSGAEQLGEESSPLGLSLLDLLLRLQYDDSGADPSRLTLAAACLSPLASASCLASVVLSVGPDVSAATSG